MKLGDILEELSSRDVFERVANFALKVCSECSYDGLTALRIKFVVFFVVFRDLFRWYLELSTRVMVSWGPDWSSRDEGSLLKALT
jgi:hypothetical protein